ncbi:MAG: BrnT family toxin [Chloroflexi bacterium]|nr:BrnT family toxin [Chloroflexota bacterium]
MSPPILNFEWNSDKAVTTFADEFAFVFDDMEHSEDEPREILIGYSERNRLLLVAFVPRADDLIRVVSARKANAQEHQVYEKKRASKINAHAPRIAKLDDYELKPHYDLDYRNARPNPFAKRVRISHGGMRPGAGRKSTEEKFGEPVERHSVTLLKSHAEFLRSLDTNLSTAIRKLIGRRA